MLLPIDFIVNEEINVINKLKASLTHFLII